MPRRLNEVTARLEKGGLTPRVMIDCSHANSNKDHLRQPTVCRDVAQQVSGGDRRIIGVMLEAILVVTQKLVKGKPLTYGQSITDACIGWDETLLLLRESATSVRESRKH